LTEEFFSDVMDDMRRSNINVEYIVNKNVYNVCKKNIMNLIRPHALEMIQELKNNGMV